MPPRGGLGLEEADAVALTGGGADDLRLAAADERVERAAQDGFGQLAEFWVVSCCYCSCGRADMTTRATATDARKGERHSEALHWAVWTGDNACTSAGAQTRVPWPCLGNPTLHSVCRPSAQPRNEP